MAKTKTRTDKIEKLFQQLASLVQESEAETAEANRQRDCAVCEVTASPVSGDLTGEPITAESLSRSLEYREKTNAWSAFCGRLRLHIRLSGDWWLTFDSTYGGSVGSYRKLKNMTELKVLMELLGVKSLASWKTEEAQQLADDERMLQRELC